MSNKDELYERLIDLSIKVAEGKVNPLDVNVSKYLSLISQLFTGLRRKEDFIKDIRALHGLITILSLQYKLLKSKSMGLHIEPILVELRMRQLSVEKIARILEAAWHPAIEIECAHECALESAIKYFEKLKPLVQRRFKQMYYGSPLVHVEKVHVPSIDIKKKLKEVLIELVKISGGSWVDYYEFIYKGDPVERAYLLSFLITEGKVEMKHVRFEDKVYIRPVIGEVRVEEYYSITTRIEGTRYERKA